MPHNLQQHDVLKNPVISINLMTSTRLNTALSRFRLISMAVALRSSKGLGRFCPLKQMSSINGGSLTEISLTKNRVVSPLMKRSAMSVYIREDRKIPLNVVFNELK